MMAPMLMLDADTVPTPAQLEAAAAPGPGTVIAGWIDWGANSGWLRQDPTAFARVLERGHSLLPMVCPLQPVVGVPWGFGPPEAADAWDRIIASVPGPLDPASRTAMIDIEAGSFAAGRGGALAAIAAFCDTGRARGWSPVLYGDAATCEASAALPAAWRPDRIWIAWWSAPSGLVGAQPADCWGVPGLRDPLYSGPDQRARQWAGNIRGRLGWSVDLSITTFTGCRRPWATPAPLGGSETPSDPSSTGDPPCR